MKTALLGALAILFAGVLQAADPSLVRHELQVAKPGRTIVADDFTQQERPNRRLTRGDWKVANGIAVCTQDEELFKKYKNHGPALWYDQPFRDAIVRFEFQP